MPMDCPSKAGNGMGPKSKTMWWVSLVVPASFTCTLPTTVALIGALGPCKLVYGWAADQGGTVEPYAAEWNTSLGLVDEALWALTSAAAVASADASAPMANNSASDSAGGKSSQENCSSRVYAEDLGRMCQLSIEPVGHGGTQAMQKLHLSAITT